MKGIELQRDFAARIRQPDAHGLLPGIAAERMAIYEELFFNNVASLVSGAFPVLRGVLGAGRWQRLVRAFLAEHRAATPYFLEISQEFIAWLQQGYRPEPDDPPFMLELAHYEWLELVLEIAEDTKLVPPATQGDLLDDVPVLNPVYQLAQYHWPVSQIAVNCEPDAPLSTPMLVLLYRDAGDVVRFMEINGITAAFVDQLNSMPELSGREHLQRLATQLPQIPVEQVLHFGADMLTDFQARGLILGTMQRP